MFLEELGRVMVSPSTVAILNAAQGGQPEESDGPPAMAGRSDRAVFAARGSTTPAADVDSTSVEPTPPCSVAPAAPETRTE